MILSYRVGEADVLEMPGLEISPDAPDEPILTRTLDVCRSPHDLLMRVAPEGRAVAQVWQALHEVDSYLRGQSTRLVNYAPNDTAQAYA